jgi:DNA polymerase III alpha subunit
VPWYPSLSAAEAEVDVRTAQRVWEDVERPRGGLTVRVGLGYVKGARKEEMESLTAAREQDGPYLGIADLASCSGASRDGLNGWPGPARWTASHSPRAAVYTRGV